MKVAYLSPLPPERSGVASYSALLLPELARHVDVEVVRRGGRPARDADVALSHVGNDAEAHGWIVRAIERRGGVVVLHDIVLHHLVASLTLGRGDREGYVRAVEREAGVVGRLLAHGVADGVLPPLWETRPEEFPLASFVLDRADGLVVHSAYAEQRARELGFEGSVRRVPYPVPPPRAGDPDPELARAGSPLVGCFGFVNAAKRIPQLLRAFARLKASFPRAVLVLAGAPVPPFDPAPHLERAGLRGGVDVLLPGYVEDDRLPAAMAACDVCVSLRSPTMGETSGIALAALALGKPLVVSDVGWFSELPDHVAAKVPVDEWEVETLAAYLELLAADPGVRERLGRAAERYVRREHDLERTAEAYAEALRAAVAEGVAA